MSVINEIAVRRMTQEDVPQADALRLAAGWNQTANDWLRFLWLEPHGCFIAAWRDKIIGTVTTTVYGPEMAWIGMMLVHPEHRRLGLGSRLMGQALEYLKSRRISTVRLDATPSGLSVYEKLGFKPEWTLTRWERPASAPDAFRAAHQPMARAMIENDWITVDAIDRPAFGIDRNRLIRRLSKDSRCTLVWPPEGAVLGWGMLRPGANADYVGPVVCGSEGATAILGSLLSAGADRRLFWDIPDSNATARAMAQQFGFFPVRPLTRMRLGPNGAASAPELQFAIADPALG